MTSSHPTDMTVPPNTHGDAETRDRPALADTSFATCQQLILGTAVALRQLVNSESLEQGIPAALEHLGAALQADRAYIFEQHYDSGTAQPLVSQQYEWVRPGITSQWHDPIFQNLPYNQRFPGWIQRLYQQQKILKTAAEFTDVERQVLAPQGVTVIYIEPILVDDILWGFVGFERLGGDLPWSVSEQALVQMVTLSLGNLLKQHQAEAELRESKQFLQLVMNNIPQMIFWKDRDSRYLGCNRSWAKMAGVGHAANVVGLTDHDLPWTDDQREWFLKCDQEVLKTGVPMMKIRQAQRQADGLVSWRETSKIPIYDEQQRVVGILGLIEDISERERTEITIREREEQFRTLLANLPGAAYRCLNDENWTMKFISEAVVDIVGHPATEYMTKMRTWSDTIYPKDRDRVVAEVTEQIAKGEPFVLEYRVRHYNGSIRWVYEKGRGVYDPSDNLVCLDGVIFDITDRKLSEDALKKSESTNRALIEAIPDFLMRMRADGTLISAAKSSEVEIYDDSVQFQGGHLFDSLPRPQAEQRLRVAREALETGELQLYEQQLTINGQLRDEEVRVTPCGKDEVLVMVRDITNRKRAEAELRQLNQELEAKVLQRTTQIQHALDRLRQTKADLEASQQRLSFMVDQAPIGVIDWDTNGCVVGWNAAAERMFGYSKSEVLGQRGSFLVAPEIKPLIDDIFAGLLTQTSGSYSKNENIRKDNQTIICDWYNTPLVDQQGVVIGIASVVIDITQQEQAQADLRKYQQKMNLLVQNTPLAVIEWTADAYVKTWNPAAEEIFGYTAAEAIGLHTEVFCTEDVKPYVAEICQALLSQKGGTRSTNTNLAKGDREIICEWYNTPITDESGEVVGLTSLIADVTEQKQAEESLRQSQEMLRLIIDNIPQRIFWKDRDLVYQGCNQSQALVSGLKTPWEIVGKTDYDMPWTKEEADFYRMCDREIMAENQPQYHIQESQHQIDGTRRWLDTNKIPLHNSDGEVIGILGTVEDITNRILLEEERQQHAEALEATVQELRHAQAQLVQSEKMSSLGQLVAGVAHEINNPVSFIYGNIEYTNQYIQDLLGLIELYKIHYPNPVEQIVDEIETIDLDFLLDDLPKMLESMKLGADRIKKIVLSLRTFSRMDEAEQKAVDIHPGIDSTVMILQHRLKANSDRGVIQVETNYGELPHIECYPGQLNQVFMNLLSNAIDALEESYAQLKAQQPDWQPRIEIETSAQTSEHIQIKIQDNGPGIPKHIQSRIFDPFFTTKSVGKGTGMGLSISYQIVTEKHQGQLYCDSTTQGTAFIIQIPVRLTSMIS